MTGTSSYVFYDSRNPQRERKENTQLNRVFITDKRVTLYRKQLVRTAKSGVLFEKIISQYSYSLHENAHGQKYIKRLDKSAAGSITDASFGLTLASRVFNSEYLNNECKVLIEGTILGWFDHIFSIEQFDVVRTKLLFPVLRDPDLPRFIEIRNGLRELQSSDPSVTKALRENDSWESFLINICPAVKDDTDVKLVNEHPDDLLAVASMNLGRTLSSFSEEDLMTLKDVRRSFSSNDREVISFLLKYSSATNRAETVDLMLRLTRQLREKFHGVLKQYRFSWTNEGFQVNRIPVKLRPVLAEHLLQSLKDLYEQLEANPFHNDREDAVSVQVKTKLAAVVRHWYALKILEPQLRTKLTLQDVEARYLELFNVSLLAEDAIEINGTAFSFKEVKELVVCRLDEKSNKGKPAYSHIHLMAGLNSMVKTNRPQDKGIYAGYSTYNGVVNAEGQFIPLTGNLYSLDDVLTIIERGAKSTDAELGKLGRPCTPENRVAFLTFGSKERKFKNTWKYYDWGVVNPDRIIAFKRHGIKSKADVQTYNELPDEMFYELLSMQSGKDTGSLANEHDTDVLFKDKALLKN